MPSLKSLISTLRTDLGDDGELVFTDDALSRALLRGRFVVARDLGLTITVTVVEDELQVGGVDAGSHAEDMLVLQGAINACSQMRASTANAVSFSNGEMRVERTNQAKAWSELEADLKTRYKALLLDKDEANVDDGILNVTGLQPVMFEHGVGASLLPTEVV